MAISGSNLTSGTFASASSGTTASITPSSNALVLVAVGSSLAGGGNTPTLSGNGLTYVLVDSVLIGSVKRISVFRALGASPSTGAITIDFASQTQTTVVWSVDQFTGVPTGGSNGSGAIVQETNNSNASSNTGLTVTLPNAFSAVGNVAYGAFVLGSANTITAGSGFTVLANSTAGTTNVGTEWEGANDTTIDATWSSSVNTAGIGIEIGTSLVIPLVPSLSPLPALKRPVVGARTTSFLTHRSIPLTPGTQPIQVPGILIYRRRRIY